MDKVDKILCDLIDDVSNFIYEDNTVLSTSDMLKLSEKAKERIVSLPTVSEWQLCPKCLGDGHLGRYNSPPYMSTTTTPQCDVCFGNKVLVKPVVYDANNS